MSNTRRPSTARKITPKDEAARKGALDMGISLNVEGKVHTVRMGDLSSLDTMALRRATGMSFMGILNLPPEQFDIDIVAAIVWLSRRIKGERLLDYESVAADIGYDSDIDFVDTPDDDAGDDSPEA